MNATIKGAIIGSVLTFIFTFVIPNLWNYFNSGPSLSVPEQSYIDFLNKTISLYITNEGNKAANDIVIQGFTDGNWTNISYIPQIRGENTPAIISIPLEDKILTNGTPNYYGGNISCPAGSETTFTNGVITQINHPIFLTNIENMSCYQTFNQTVYNTTGTLGEFGREIAGKLIIRIYCKDCPPKYYTTFAENNINATGYIENSFCFLRLCNATLCYDSKCTLEESMGAIKLTELNFIPSQVS